MFVSFVIIKSGYIFHNNIMTLDINGTSICLFCNMKDKINREPGVWRAPITFKFTTLVFLSVPSVLHLHMEKSQWWAIGQHTLSVFCWSR